MSAIRLSPYCHSIRMEGDMAIARRSSYGLAVQHGTMSVSILASEEFNLVSVFRAALSNSPLDDE